MYEGNLRQIVGRASNPGKYFEPLANQMLAPLAYLAEKNIIHRNVTPSNILHDAQ
jgi:serine/threonine protein kinase